jgi:hypothetical protein
VAAFILLGMHWPYRRMVRREETRRRRGESVGTPVPLWQIITYGVANIILLGQVRSPRLGGFICLAYLTLLPIVLVWYCERARSQPPGAR